MELSQLIYFREVARCEHFTKAASNLYIAQPSLSKAIANLENELGLPLFDREGKGVRLNPYGRAMLEKVEEILSLVDEAKLILQDMKEGNHGHIQIGSSFPITPPSPLYYYQYTFFRSHSQVGLSIHMLTCERIESLLEERQLDLGVSQVPAARPTLSSFPLYTDRLGIVVGPEHPLANQDSVRLEKVAGEKFLCNNSTPDINDSAHHLCEQAGFVPHVIYEGESAELIGESVAMGRGISFVSEARYYSFTRRADAPDWERELHYVALENDFCTRTVYLLEKKSGYRTRATEDFCAGLKEYLE